MWRRWFFLGLLVPVLAIANTGCLVGGATVFIADATVLGSGTSASPKVYVRFKYDVRDGKMRMKGHYRDPGGLQGAGKGVNIKFQGVLAPDPLTATSPAPCMGALVKYIAEDPNHPHSGDIVDMNGLPLMPNEGMLLIDACDNNRDDDMSIGDNMDIEVIDGPYASYFFLGNVVDGKFECKAPEPTCDQDL
jgi:hypothetical protein